MAALKTLQRPGFYLLICLAIAAGVFIRYPDNSWQGALALNMVAEVLGILGTVLLVDRIISARAHAERQRVRQLAFRTLGVGLGHHIMLLQQMYKAAANAPPQVVRADAKELFSDDFYATVTFLDMAARTPLGPPWANHCANAVGHLRAAVSQVLDRYLLVLESDDIEALEDVSNTALLGLLEKLPVVFDLDRQEGVARTYNLLAGAEGIFRKHVGALRRVMDIHEASQGRPLSLNPGLWRDDIEPKIGSARVPASAMTASAGIPVRRGLPPEVRPSSQAEG